MLAAKEKTISSYHGSTFTWSPRGTYVQTAATSHRHRPTTTNHDRVSARRFTELNFKTRKSEKSPIGPKVKSRSNSPWQNQHPRGKTLGETGVNYDELHWAPGMSQYRAYFVPGAMDPMGFQLFFTPSPQVVPLVSPKLAPLVRPVIRPVIRPTLTPRPVLTPRPLPPTPPGLPIPPPTLNPVPTPTPSPHPSPSSNPKPEPQMGPRCPNDCEKRFGLPRCPYIKGPEGAANDFLAGQGVNNGRDLSEVISMGCQKIQDIGRGSRACSHGGETYHCNVIVRSRFTFEVTPFEISIFVCKCCWEKHPGAYAKTFGTPQGHGAPHWARATSSRGLDGNGNPVTLDNYPSFGSK